MKFYSFSNNFASCNQDYKFGWVTHSLATENCVSSIDDFKKSCYSIVKTDGHIAIRVTYMLLFSYVLVIKVSSTDRIKCTNVLPGSAHIKKGSLSQCTCDIYKIYKELYIYTWCTSRYLNMWTWII